MKTGGGRLVASRTSRMVDSFKSDSVSSAPSKVNDELAERVLGSLDLAGQVGTLADEAGSDVYSMPETYRVSHVSGVSARFSVGVFATELPCNFFSASTVMADLLGASGNERLLAPSAPSSVF